MESVLFEETFDNYHVDMYNRNAYLTAKDFVKKKMRKRMMLGIYGLEGVGKTRLLRAIANYFLMEDPTAVVYITGEELYQELRKAIRRKDIFILTLKWKFRKAKVVCLDEVHVLIMDDEVEPWFMHWFRHCKRRGKRMIYTQDCDEKLYCAMQMIATLDERATLVGIPKPGQNRNMEVMREVV